MMRMPRSLSWFPLLAIVVQVHPAHAAGTTGGAMPAAEASALSRSVVTTKDPQTLLPALTRALKSYGSDPHTHLLLARTYLRLGYTGLADDELAAADKLKPGFVLDWLGQQSVQPGSAPPTDLYAYAGDHYPKDPRTIFLHARVLRANSMPTQAKTILAQLDDTPNPPNGVYAMRAELALADERFGDALRFAARELARHPSDQVAGEVELCAKIMLKQAPSDSFAQLSRFYAASRVQPVLATLLADQLVARGDLKAALEPAIIGFVREPGPKVNAILQKDLRTLIKQLPSSYITQTADRIGSHVLSVAESAWFHLRLAKLLSECGRDDAAATQYDLAGTIHPFFAGAANFQAGQALEKKARKPKEALEYYRRAYLARPYDKQIAASYARLDQRLPLYNQDLSWRLKDWLLKPKSAK